VVKLYWFGNCVGLEKGNNLNLGGLPMNHRKRTAYTKEFKREAVNLIVEQGYSIVEASRNLGINYNMLSRWKNKVEMSGVNAFPCQGHKRPEQFLV